MTFAELMDCWNQGDYNCNQAVYNKIAEQAKQGNLVPVVGAGLSAWVGYPMWDALLSRHAAEFEVETAVNRHLAAWEYDEAAEVLEKACGDAWFDILRDSFDPNQIAQRRGERPAYQKWLPELFRGLVLTTNFDRCLEDLYGDAESVNPGDDFQKKRAERAGFENRHLLIKLHGDIQDPWNMVLTKSAYDACYGAEADSPDLMKPMPAYLAQQVNRRPMLFLGCSLHQDRTCTVLRKCSRIGAHYALLPRPREDGEFKKRRSELSELNIRPIWYPAGAHDEALSVFFNQLAADCGLREEPAGDTPVYPLVGRDAVVAELCDHFSGPNPEPRWVTGVAGIGKTEVCREVIRRLRAKKPGYRMPMVDCTSAESLDQFYSAVSRGLDRTIPAERAADPGPFLAQVLAGESGVYFDNFEDIWRSTSGETRKELMTWLLGLRDAGLALLFSTQDRLPSVLGRGAALGELDGGAKDALTMEEGAFLNLDSVKLFTHIYGEVGPEELPHLRKLIRQMEGHPLAIVLTANQAREKALGLRTMVDRWDAVQEVYRGNERHTSLANALALVWEELKDDPDAVLYWALHAQSVQPIPVEFHGLLLRETERAGMDRLLTGSLIRNDGERIAMLLPVKKQLEMLSPDWQTVKVQALHRWAVALTELMKRADDGSREDRDAAHVLAIALVPQVCHVLRALAEPEYDGTDLLCQLLAAAGNHYQYDLTALDTLRFLAEQDVLVERSGYQGIAYKYFGDLLVRLSKLNEALEAYTRAEELFRKEQDDLGLANTLCSRGNLLARTGKLDEAIKAYTQAEELYRKERADLGLANTLCSEGDLLARTGKPEEALEAYARAEELYRKERDDLGLANTLRSRGDLLARTGKPEEALEAYARAEELYRQERNDLGLANTLCSEGDLLARTGKPEEALEAYARAEELHRQERDDLGLANTLSSRADLLFEQEQYPDALKLYRKACGLYRKERVTDWVAYTLADQYRCLLRTEEAVESVEAAEVRRELDELLPELPRDVREYAEWALSLEASARDSFWSRIFRGLKKLLNGGNT